MQISAYLVFPGNCEEAFQTYAKIFGGKIEGVFKWGGTPAEQSVPPQWKDKVMHASVRIGNDALMGVDEQPDRYQAPKGISISVHLSEAAEAERIFSALAEQGAVSVPMQETFWAIRFGMLTDRFGIPWMINCGRPM